MAAVGLVVALIGMVVFAVAQGFSRWKTVA